MGDDGIFYPLFAARLAKSTNLNAAAEPVIYLLVFLDTGIRQAKTQTEVWRQ